MAKLVSDLGDNERRNRLLRQQLSRGTGLPTGPEERLARPESRAYQTERSLALTSGRLPRLLMGLVLHQLLVAPGWNSRGDQNPERLWEA